MNATFTHGDLIGIRIDPTACDRLVSGELIHSGQGDIESIYSNVYGQNEDGNVVVGEVPAGPALWHKLVAIRQEGKLWR